MNTAHGRTENIPVLAEHFVVVTARDNNRPEVRLPAQAVEALAHRLDTPVWTARVYSFRVLSEEANEAGASDRGVCVVPNARVFLDRSEPGARSRV